MQHIEALSPAIACQDVCRRVALGMPDMQTCPRRVGEHVENVEFRRQIGSRRRPARQIMAQPEGVGFRNVVSRVPRPEGLLCRPVPLPPGFNQMERVLPPRHIRPPAWRDHAPRSNPGVLYPFPQIATGSVPPIYTKGATSYHHVVFERSPDKAGGRSRIFTQKGTLYTIFKTLPRSSAPSALTKSASRGGVFWGYCLRRCFRRSSYP